jgi:hypothetical protein
LICVGIIALAVYFIPVVIALMRGHPDTLAISAVCILFGWSFLGWGIALVWSLTGIRKPQPQVVIHQSGGAIAPQQNGGNPFDFG